MRTKKAEHACEYVSGWDEIYVDHEGDWVLNANGGDAVIMINYCPFCGEKLEKVTQ